MELYPAEDNMIPFDDTGTLLDNTTLLTLGINDMDKKNMPSSLNAIKIKGFKSIRELDSLRLRSMNVLIGANGSGKTNFIHVFRMLNQIVEENFQRFVATSGGADALLYFGQKKTDEIVVDLEFGNHGYHCSLIPAAGDILVFAEESVWFHEGARTADPYTVSLGNGQKETSLYEESRSRPDMGIAEHVMRGMKSWKVYHFHDTSPSAKVKLTGEINDNAVLRSDASNLAAFLYLLKNKYPASYKKIVAAIQLVAPFFGDFVLRPSQLNPDRIQLEWEEKGSDAYFNAHSLSDGTLRFICLATLLLQPDLPATILIDEPELGLHPYAISLLAGLLNSAAAQTQVIVSTQSTALVNQFTPEDIIVVDREDGQSTFHRLNEQNLKHWLDDYEMDGYGLGDLWEKNVFGGRPR